MLNTFGAKNNMHTMTCLLAILMLFLFLSGCSGFTDDARETNDIFVTHTQTDAPADEYSANEVAADIPDELYTQAVSALEDNDIKTAVVLLRQSINGDSLLCEIRKYEDGLEYFYSGDFDSAYNYFLEAPNIPLSQKMIDVYKTHEDKLADMSLAEQDCIRVLEQAISISAYEDFILNQVYAYNYHSESDSTDQRALIFDYSTVFGGEVNESFFAKCAILPNYYSSINKELQRYDVEKYEIENPIPFSVMPNTIVEWPGAIQDGLIELIDFEKESGVTESDIEYTKIDLSKVNACFEFIDLLIAENKNPWERVLTEDEKLDTPRVFPKEPKIGMTSDEVLESTWGEPEIRNISEYSWGIKEQWVYSNNRYIYLENGIVTSISYSK